MAHFVILFLCSLRMSRGLPMGLQAGTGTSALGNVFDAAPPCWWPLKTRWVAQEDLMEYDLHTRCAAETRVF